LKIPVVCKFGATSRARTITATNTYAIGGVTFAQGVQLFTTLAFTRGYIPLTRALKYIKEPEAYVLDLDTIKLSLFPALRLASYEKSY